MMPDGAISRLVVHHDGVVPSRSKPNMTIEQESAIMRIFEDFHARTLTPSSPRIGYTFVVMQSGRVYEGVGWRRIGAHVANLNSSSYGWCFPINGTIDAPTPAAVEAFRRHVAEGIRLKHIATNYVVKGHQDFNKPSCPGSKLYQAVVAGYTPWREPSNGDVRPPAPQFRWSNSLGDWVIVTRYVDDHNWWFVTAKTAGKGARETKAQTPFSQMPR
jgi:hypothetical protein